MIQCFRYKNKCFLQKDILHKILYRENNMKIALLGYGTVGKSVEALLLRRDTGIRLKTILRKPGKAVAPNMTDDFSKILNDPEIDAVVEVLSGTEPAFSYIKEALSAGKHVVSANKAALAAAFPELLSLAEANGVQLLYEASCGGGIPWIESIKKAAKLDTITSLKGILNGTANYILDRMERFSADFSEALSEAQALGYAEADPSADIGGFDIRNKALISCSLAYRTAVRADFPVLGIEKLTKEQLSGFLKSGRHLRLMMFSRREQDRYALGVAPLLLPSGAVEASVRENYNCASFCGEFVGELKFYGQGAGGFPTADAVVQDLIALRGGKAEPVQLSEQLIYDERLLSGTGFFPDGEKTGTFAELARLSEERGQFMAFSLAELS